MRCDVLGADAVADGVHAVAQGDVLDEDGGAHAWASWSSADASRAAMRSATCSAAEVMMSRLPAYAGR